MEELILKIIDISNFQSIVFYGILCWEGSLENFNMDVQTNAKEESLCLLLYLRINTL